MSENVSEKKVRLSYKEMLTNMLVVFINKRIKESKDMESKIETLSEERKKIFQTKMVDFVIEKAKSLAQLQGTDYLGVEDETVVGWIDSFFDEFEERMKEPEKKATVVKTTTTETKKATKKETKPTKTTFELEEGFFGLEIRLDKKTVLSKEDFIKRMKENNPGQNVEFAWLDTTVEVLIGKQEEIEEPEKDQEVVETVETVETEETEEVEETDETEDQTEEEDEEGGLF